MKSVNLLVRFFPFAIAGVVLLTACGNNGNPPENSPTPVPSPEEKPTQSAPIEGTSQPRDTTFVLPKT